MKNVYLYFMHTFFLHVVNVDLIKILLLTQNNFGNRQYQKKVFISIPSLIK